MPKKSTTSAPVVATMLPAEGQKSAAAAQKEIARLSAKVATERLTAAEPAKLADAKRAAKAAPAKKPPRKLAKTTAKAPAKKAAAAPASDSGRIPLKAICQKLDIDPKRARVALRRRLRNGDLAGGTHEIGGGRWMLTEAQAARVRDTLREFIREQA